MLAHFGTVFAVCHNYDSLTLLNFHKINVSRGTVAKWMLQNVSRGTKVVDAENCFTWNNKC